MTENTTAGAGGSSERGLRASLSAIWWRFVRWLAGLNGMAIMALGFGLGVLADRSPTLEPYAVWFFLGGGLLPVVLMTIPTDEEGYDVDISNRDRAVFVVAMLLWSITPTGILTQILQIGGNVVPYIRYRGKLPSTERHAPETDLSLPFDGEWTTVNGGVTKETSHSWGLVSQRYAYDFVVTDEDGETHERDGEQLEDYYAFGEPLSSPADGTVVATEDSLRDYPTPGSVWPEWRTYKITGNYVVIEHDDGEYSMLAHLKGGSVTVEPGDTVQCGDVVGACGNSGNSSEPHLHYQLMDISNFWAAAGLVPRFSSISVSRDDDARTGHAVYGPLPEEGSPTYLRSGDRVSTVRD